MICEYCKKEFKTSSSLNLHIKTAKYCLKIQGKSISELQYKCDCDKIFTTKQHLSNHIDKCVIKENNILTSENILLKKKIIIE